LRHLIWGSNTLVRQTAARCVQLQHSPRLCLGYDNLLHDSPSTHTCTHTPPLPCYAYLWASNVRCKAPQRHFEPLIRLLQRKVHGSCHLFACPGTRARASKGGRDRVNLVLCVQRMLEFRTAWQPRQTGQSRTNRVVRTRETVGGRGALWQHSLDYQLQSHP
jgi:hypothetical protein